MSEESRNPLTALREVTKVAHEVNGSAARLERLIETLKFMLVVSRYDALIPPGVAERIGGKEKVLDGVELLYERLTDDPDLGPYFRSLNDEEMAHLIQQQAKMLVALLGAGEFVGRPLSEAHHPLNITEAHFERLLVHVAAVLPRIGLTPDEVDLMVVSLRNFKPEIVAPVEGVA